MSKILKQEAGALPVWAREDRILSITGLAQNEFRRICNMGVVRAYRADPPVAKSAITFRVSDVLDYMEEHASKPPHYVLNGESKS